MDYDGREISFEEENAIEGNFGAVCLVHGLIGREYITKGAARQAAMDHSAVHGCVTSVRGHACP